jgi:5-methylcytosine-specific restriction endonuclease McrA
MSLPCESDSYPSTETRACVKCAKVKHLKSFGTNGGSRPGWRVICRACRKTGLRRKQGIQPKPPRRVKTEGEARATLLRKMRSGLARLFEQKAEAAGVEASSVEYQVRYRTNPTFREKEIARTWARKEASGVGRTDGRASRPMHTDGTLTPSVVAGLFAQAKGCAYCHEPMHPRDKTLDHVVPVSKGGIHSITNVVIACKSCNSRKRARTPEQWLSADRGTDSGAVRHVA